MNPYLRDAILTATPEQLQLMLYDGAIRFATQGQEALRRKDFNTSYQKLQRAQKIIQEMQAGLRFDVNPELCERVAGLYRFMYHKLIEASFKRDPSLIDDVLKVLRMERETWRILVEKVNEVRGEGAPTTSAPGSGHPARAEHVPPPRSANPTASAPPPPTEASLCVEG